MAASMYKSLISYIIRILTSELIQPTKGFIGLEEPKINRVVGA
jgi:hypothetical protein